MVYVIINPNSTASMTDAMLSQARAAAPHLHFEGWTSTQGPASIQGREDGDQAARPLLKLVEQASDEGAEGIIIGCFDDTALAASAQIARCPVIGIGQAAYHFAALRNWRFSVVTTLNVSVPVLEENIRNLGLSGYLARVRASDVPVLELENDPAASGRRILEETRTAVQCDGIDAVILGCAGMVQVVEIVRKAVDVAIIDPVACAAHCLSWLGSEQNTWRA